MLALQLEFEPSRLAPKENATGYIKPNKFSAMIITSGTPAIHKATLPIVFLLLILASNYRRAALAKPGQISPSSR